MDKQQVDWIIKNYGSEWSDKFIIEVEEETPENFTDEYRKKITEFFKKILYDVNGLNTQ